MRSGHAHHCEALPRGHRLKRPTKGGANRSRTNNAPPPCENLHDRRFFTRTFLRSVRRRMSDYMMGYSAYDA